MCTLVVNYAGQEAYAAAALPMHVCERAALLKPVFSLAREGDREELANLIGYLSKNLPDWRLVNLAALTHDDVKHALALLDSAIERDLSATVSAQLSAEHRQAFIAGAISGIQRNLHEVSHVSLVVPAHQWLATGFENTLLFPYLRLEHEFIHAGIQHWGRWDFGAAFKKLDLWLLVLGHTNEGKLLATHPQTQSLAELKSYLSSLLIFSAEVEVAQMMLAHYHGLRKDQGAPAILWNELVPSPDERVAWHKGRLPHGFNFFGNFGIIQGLHAYIVHHAPKAAGFWGLKQLVDANLGLENLGDLNVADPEKQLVLDIVEICRAAFLKLEKAGFKLRDAENLEIPTREFFYQSSLEADPAPLPLLNIEDATSLENALAEVRRAVENRSYEAWLTSALQRAQSKPRKDYPLRDQRLEERADAKILR